MRHVMCKVKISKLTNCYQLVDESVVVVNSCLVYRVCSIRHDACPSDREAVMGHLLDGECVVVGPLKWLLFFWLTVCLSVRLSVFAWLHNYFSMSFSLSLSVSLSFSFYRSTSLSTILFVTIYLCPVIILSFFRCLSLPLSST